MYCINRFIALKLFIGEICYILLNIYLNCDYLTIESLIEYEENLAEIEEKFSDEEYDELILSGYFNSDLNKERLFKS